MICSPFSVGSLGVLRPLLLCCALACSQAQAGDNLIPNPGVEADDGSWGIFVPGESENKGCEFSFSKESPHSGTSCLELKSGDLARFSVGPKGLTGDAVRPGDRCRLTFWVRAGNDLQVKSAPPLIVRMFLLDDQGHNLPENLAIFVGLNGKTTIQSPEKGLDFSPYKEPLPAEWTKVESVFEMPTDLGAGRLSRPEFFAQYTSGSIFLDDFSLERVGSEVPLSPTFQRP